jgi:SOS response regulatory protein OraA/RecX
MTAKRLRNIAIYYCQRYVTSTAKLKDHLGNRLFREVETPEEREALACHIPEIVADMVGMGLVDDGEAAAAKLRGALRAGYAKSTAVGIAARKLMMERNIVTQELPAAFEDAVPDIDGEELDEGEEAAALARLALRRARRGPFRPRGANETTRRRDIAWLQRRGYRYDAIRQVIDVDEDDD